MSVASQRGRILSAVLCLLALLGAAAIALYFALPGLIERTAIRAAESPGLENVRLEFRQLSAWQLELGAIRAGADDDLSIDTLRIETNIDLLRRGRAERVTLSDLSLRAVLGAEGLSLPALDPILKREGSADSEPAPPGLPAQQVELTNGRVVLETPSGSTTAYVDARAEADETGAIDFSAKLRDLTESAVLEVSGAQDLASARGRAQIELLPIQFAPGEFAPADLFPPLAEQLEQVSGRVGAEGQLAWESQTVRGELALELNDLSFTSAGFEVQGVNSRVQLSQPWPPETSTPQQLTVDAVQAGMALGGGSIKFELRPGNVLELNAVDWHALGGRIQTQGRFDPSATRHAFTLELRDLDAAKLVELLDLQDLELTGTLSGSLPLAVEGRRIFVEHGSMASLAPGGVLRYRAATPSPTVVAATGGVELVLAALRNFQYEALSMKVQGELTGDALIQVQLVGANPEVYNGHPFEINLNLDAPIGSLMRSATLGYDVPELLEQGPQAGDSGGSE